MGWVRKHTGTDGKPRYTATYRDARDRKRSAGTFPCKRDADRAWQQAELLLAQGRMGGADTGKLTFTRYVDEIWFPNHVLEPSTRESYRYSIDKHLKPTFGSIRMSTSSPATSASGSPNASPPAPRLPPSGTTRSSCPRSSRRR